MNSEFDFWGKRVEVYLSEALYAYWEKHGDPDVEDIVKAIMPIVEAYALHVSDMEAAGDDL